MGNDELSSTLRSDLMDAIGRFRDMNLENARAQDKSNQEGLVQALQYISKADASDSLAMTIHFVLTRHGI